MSTPIPNHPKYNIDKLGNVWSTITNKYLTPQTDHRGYLVVKIAGTYKSVHRLLGYAYLGLTEDMTINHLNGDKQDNRLNNLEVCTNAENMNHAYATGVKSNPFGEQARNAKLTKEEVDEIRSNFGVISHRLMAEKFGVHKSTISKIRTHKNWSKD